MTWERQPKAMRVRSSAFLGGSLYLATDSPYELPPN